MRDLEPGLLAVGSALPARQITNEEWEPTLGVPSGWITARTGVHTRGHASPDETASSLALAAARSALARAGREPADLGCVIVATSTPDYPMPPTSVLVQDRLGAVNAGAFDVNAACAGFVYALSTGLSLVRDRTVGTCLVIGVDLLLSRHVSPRNWDTAALFGDGAGAVLIGLAPGARAPRSVMRADGSRWRDVLIEAGGSAVPATAATHRFGKHLLRMSGVGSYRSAVQSLVAVARGLGGVEACDLVVPHQANIRILRECAHRLEIPDERLVVTVPWHGNTAAASVPLALDHAWSTGRIPAGDRLMLLGFGAGYTWGGLLVDAFLADPPDRAEPRGDAAVSSGVTP